MAERKEKTISFNYLVQGLEIGVDEVERVKNIELRNLQGRRKLCLVLDLDHTLLHSKRVFIQGPPITTDDDIYQWKLNKDEYYLTKLRPFVRQFLEEASKMFELYVYTRASRHYALHIVQHFLDPQGVYFGKRVIAREDCTIAGQKGLDVVPVHPSAVLILDDKESVWETNFANLIVIDKYHYFSQVGGEEELKYALEVLTKIHTLYFKRYDDRFTDSDVRDLMETHWEDIVNDEGKQQLGTGTCSSDIGFAKRSSVD